MQLSAYDIDCLQRVKEFIDSNITRGSTIIAATQYAGISSTKLKAGFKKLYGASIYHYQKEQRLAKAKYQLENTDRTIKSLSRESGFKHTCNFITAFRKKYGMPPAVWKKNML
jgi:AraC-like DNA-binding protein